MQYITNFLILAGVFFTPWLYAQIPPSESTDQYQYAAPVDIPMLLSGNYGEIRSTHFHSGIDIKTEQVEGKNITAAQEGYVFRIVVNSGGYGRALYLRHPNGQVTVYAHMQQFVPALEEYVRQNQYHLNSFEVDLYPAQDQFVFNKGDHLGLTGNSGNSEGPHLHFEIRDQSSAIPLNVLEYGFDIMDNVKPVIQTLAVYPLDKNSRVNGAYEKVLVQPALKNGHYVLPENTVGISGNIGLGIETYDYLNNSPNPCSPLSIAVYLDDRLFFLSRLDSIPFAQAGYVNSYVDYGEKIKSGKNIHKLFIDPNNQLNVYKIAIDRGILKSTNTALQSARIVVKDTYGNESFLTFKIQHSDMEAAPIDHEVDSTVVGRFLFNKLNVFEKKDIRIAIPQNALFDNIDFHYTVIKSDSCRWSALHQVHNEYTPLLKPYLLSIKPYDIPSPLQNKCYIASRGEKGELVSHGGEYNGGFITTKLKTFGRFFVELDTLDPVITPVNFVSGNRYASGQSISFSILDTGSGIRKYYGYIDDKWSLFEYDAKNNLLTYTVDGNMLQQDITHMFVIIVTDNKDNVARFKGRFLY